MNTTILNKFYNIDAPEQPSAPSIAAIMASKGVVTTADSQVEIPSINTTEKQEEPQAQPEPTPVATTTEASNGAEANQESPKPPSSEPPAEPTPQIEETPAQVQLTWQEVLKQQQPEAIIKELGYDAGAVALAKEINENPQMLAFYNHWKSNGDVTAYLKELSTDYSKMPAEEVMKHQLRTEYPRADERTINILFQKKIVDAYKLNPDVYDESEVEEGRLLLEAEADKYRDGLVEKQKGFLLPKAPEPQATTVPAEPEPDGKKELEAYQTSVMENDYTKSVFSNKVLNIGEGEEGFKYPIQDPKALTDILFDSNAWASKFFNIQKNPDGSEKYIPDVEKQLFVAAAVHDHKTLIREIAKHYKSLGGKAAIDPIENASLPDGSTPSKSVTQYASVAEAMAKSGRLTG
jgi:hypothetical protein